MTAAQDVTTPTLEMIAFFAPPIPGEDWLGSTNSQSSSGSDQPNTSGLGAFTFGTGATEAAIQTMLAESSTAVNKYTALKKLVDSDRDWLFQVKEAQYLSLGSKIAFTNKKGQTADGAIMNQDMVAAEDSTLRGVADTITLVGQFLAWLNHTAQAYANADINCEMPKPVPPGHGKQKTTAKPKPKPTTLNSPFLK